MQPAFGFSSANASLITQAYSYLKVQNEKLCTKRLRWLKLLCCEGRREWVHQMPSVDHVTQWLQQNGMTKGWTQQTPCEVDGVRIHHTTVLIEGNGQSDLVPQLPIACIIHYQQYQDVHSTLFGIESVHCRQNQHVTERKSQWGRDLLHQRSAWEMTVSSAALDYHWTLAHWCCPPDAMKWERRDSDMGIHIGLWDAKITQNFIKWSRPAESCSE